MNKYMRTTSRKTLPLMNTGLLLCLCLGLPTTVVAQDTPPSNSFIYYQMGGAAAITGSLNASVNVNPIPLAPRFKQPSSCEIWANRRNLGEHAERVIEDFVDTQLASAQGLVSGVVSIVKSADDMIAIAALERALPGMYDWMNNMTSLINVELEASMESCRAATRNLQAGAGMLDAWTDTTLSVAWGDTLSEDHDWQSADGHLNVVAREIHETAMNTPIEWFGGEAGAAAGEPVKITEGIISAGYGTLSEELYDGSVITAPTDVETTVFDSESTASVVMRESRLSRLFESSTDAVDFATQVVGEESFEWCTEDDCETSVTPGIGLRQALTDETTELLVAWAALLAAYPPLITVPPSPTPLTISNPTIEDLRTVSSETTYISQAIYTAIRNKLPQERSAFISRLARDVALERTTDKALALIEMAESGSRHPEVQTYAVTREKAEQMTDRVRDSIDSLTYEIEVKRKSASRTAELILVEQAAILQTAAQLRLGTGSSAKRSRLEGGDVLPVD